MKEMTIREVQMVSLDILKDVHEFCMKNDIKYSLCGGTLIGAIRHNGFIPWDDDVDIVMPRPEYDRFIRTYQSEKGYRLFSREIEGGENVRIRLTKICDMEKTVMDHGPYAWVDVETGIGIDVIPADGAPDTKDEARRHIKKLVKYARFIGAYRSRYATLSSMYRYPKLNERIRFLCKKIWGYFLNGEIVTNFINCQKKYDYNSSSFFCAGFGYGIGEWQSKKIFDEFILHQFEDSKFCITKQYDEYLRNLFGNYMELPPEEKRKNHSFFKYYWK